MLMAQVFVLQNYEQAPLPEKLLGFTHLHRIRVRFLQIIHCNTDFRPKFGDSRVLPNFCVARDLVEMGLTFISYSSIHDCDDKLRMMMIMMTDTMMMTETMVMTEMMMMPKVMMIVLTGSRFGAELPLHKITSRRCAIEDNVGALVNLLGQDYHHLHQHQEHYGHH